ncbi:hypothetical protein ADK18_24585 [Bacillus anthracis]|nr:hypothetical protein ADK17_25750 [Bacillus anthracis]KOS25438.1 hypothetical protein ADK18_24585 [Bacillus anthracis]
MKQINMLWISDLANRIRTNINMLFIVAMLSTLAFTMITFLYGFGKFTKLDAISELTLSQFLIFLIMKIR